MSFRIPSLVIISLTLPAVETLIIDAAADPLLTSTTDAARVALGHVAGATSVISAEEVKRGRAATVRDLLATTPGVYVQPRLGAEESRLSIRGSGIQRTFHLRGICLLIDGIPTNQADGGGDFQVVDPGLLEHTEVYRGADALRYGAATLGGAINLVTPTGRTAPMVDVRAEAGSFGYHKLTAAGSTAGEQLDGHLALSGYEREGYQAHSRQDNQRIFANTGWRFSPTLENRLYLGYADSESELPGSLTKVQLENVPTQAVAANVTRDAKRDFPLLRAADRMTWVDGDQSVEGSVGWTGKDLFHPLTFGLIEQDSHDVNASARWSNHAPAFGQGNRMTVGANAAYGVTDAGVFAYVGTTGHTKGAATSQAVQTARTLDVYTEWQHEFSPHWWSVVGLQAVTAYRDYDDELPANGDQSGYQTYNGLNPKLGVLWQIAPLTAAFANVSRSFEPPTFSEFVQVNAPGTPSIPLTDLEAQSAWTFELGTRGREALLIWDVALYHALISNEYLSYEVQPGLNQTTNADQTTHTGLELGTEATVLHGALSHDDALIFANTYTWGRFRFDDDAVCGDNQLPGLPEHIWRTELRWEWQRWYFGPVVEYSAGWPIDFRHQVETDSVWLLHARAGYQADRGWSGFIEGRNLTDEIYAATSGIVNPSANPNTAAIYNPGDGLAVYAGLEWSH